MAASDEGVLKQFTTSFFYGSNVIHPSFEVYNYLLVKSKIVCTSLPLLYKTRNRSFKPHSFFPTRKGGGGFVQVNVEDEHAGCSKTLWEARTQTKQNNADFFSFSSNL